MERGQSLGEALVLNELAASAFRRVGVTLGLFNVVSAKEEYILFKLLYIIIYNNYI